jgi:putative YhdH/YhfP family quinone oxidoreductase
MNFRAFVVQENEGKFQGSIEKKNLDFLPQKNLLINVKYSSLNYKDALSAVGNKGVTRNYPHIPGVDAAGIVVESKSSDFSEGDEVLVTGFEMGSNSFGGFSEYLRVPADWALKLPNNLSLRESMIYGTAGFTAALSVYKIEKVTSNAKGDEVLVTGASGGVGSLSIAILKRSGYKNITAATGKLNQINFLKKIGADNVIDRKFLKDESKRPLLHSKWGNAVDVVGGDILEYIVRSTKEGGAVASCGLVSSNSLNLSVFPFILRGVSLLGIDSAHCKMEMRKEIWNKMANEWKVESLDMLCKEIAMDELDDKIDEILKGKMIGRVLVNMDK